MLGDAAVEFLADLRTQVVDAVRALVQRRPLLAVVEEAAVKT